MGKIREILDNRDDDTPIYFTSDVLDILKISKKTLDRYRIDTGMVGKGDRTQKRRYSCKDIALIIDIIKKKNGV
jgi:DNA-binding transcriptional MerR regulator